MLTVNLSYSQTIPEIVKTVFLVGGTGEVQSKEATPTMINLCDQVNTAINPATIFLGNNVSEAGFPSLGKKGRAEVEEKVIGVINQFRDHEGEVFLIPGNNEWANGHLRGYQSVLNIESFIEDRFDGRNVFFPDDACPGPNEFQLSEDLVLVILNTPWLIYPWDKPETESSCSSKSLGDILVHLEDVLLRNTGKKIIVAGHHPLLSYGKKGLHHDNYLLKETGSRDGLIELFKEHKNLICLSVYFPKPIPLI